MKIHARTNGFSQRYRAGLKFTQAEVEYEVTEAQYAVIVGDKNIIVRASTVEQGNAPTPTPVPTPAPPPTPTPAPTGAPVAAPKAKKVATKKVATKKRAAKK
jgi:hypothetical protein